VADGKVPNSKTVKGAARPSWAQNALNLLDHKKLVRSASRWTSSLVRCSTQVAGLSLRSLKTLAY
jgi:hypothetical protein